MSRNHEWDYALIAAIDEGNAAEVRRMMAAGASLDISNDCGQTPLGMACACGDLAMMDCLLGLGADADEIDYEGAHAIWYAMCRQHYAAVDYLLDYGTQEARVKRGETALYCAAEYGDLALTRRLLERDIDVNVVHNQGETPLMVAVKRTGWVTEEEAFARRRQVARALLERGADVTLRSRGVTAMYWACRLGDAVTVALLRQAGATIELTEAAALGDVEITRILLDKGEDPNTPDPLGGFALRLAASNGHADVARLLLERGADPYSVSDDAYTALSAAADAEHLDVVNVFLDHALTNDNAMYCLGEASQANTTTQARLAALLVGRSHDINPSDPDDLTPLIEAAASGSLTKARLLIQAGADVNLSNQDGFTPLICAAERGSLEMTRLLLSTGADANIVKEDSRSTLFCAIGDGMRRRTGYVNTPQAKHTARTEVLALIKLLIEHGADVNMRTDFNSTLLEYALENEHADVAELLKTAGAKTSEAE